MHLFSYYKHLAKFHAPKEENPLIQVPEHLFLVILSNEGFLCNLNIEIYKIN